METNISRRNLIKGGAAFAAAATLLGASACSPRKDAETPQRKNLISPLTFARQILNTAWWKPTL